MKQVVQTLKDGKIQVLDFPPPVLNKGMLLVKNYYSLISPGTEGSTVRVAKKSLVGKALDRPQHVKQVIEVLKSQGPLQTYRAVKKKLDAYSPLGYSAAGKVIAIGEDVAGFEVGDWVACGGGGYANHAEVVAVPKNLCVKIPPEADLKRAAFNTLGAIALQGIRQTDLKIGETAVVIGLGLIGQLTCLILRESSVKVIGVDIDSKMVDIANEHCVDFAIKRDESSIEAKIFEFTDGIGADAIIITAATKSLDPINFAGSIARKKGKVVIVGDVPTGYEREHFYKKELELRISCSYGPGRYDMNYEEKGIDYPVGYVRWTEKRNMKAFQELIHSGKVNLDYITTHIFDLKDAQKAYDLILKKEEPYLGILIRYDVEHCEFDKRIEIRERKPEGKVNLAFIGVGNYAQNYLLPNIPKSKDLVLKGVMDSIGTNARSVAEKYGFEFCTCDEDDILKNEEINTVYIATRHDSHADYVIKSLKARKNVIVEKPLCLKESELEQIKKVYKSLSGGNASPFLMVGFNRRFSPLTEILKERLGHGPLAMIYRINAGHISPDSWIQDHDIGGGRVIGEVCHFVDFLTFINGSLPESVFASAMTDPANLVDTLNVNLEFKNGSIGTISYLSNGVKSLFKEYIEIYKTRSVGVVKDFKELEIYGDGKTYKKKLISQDKGQKSMIKNLIDSLKGTKLTTINFESIYAVTLTTFKIIESIRTKKGLRIS